MLPERSINNDINIIKLPSKTYKINFTKEYIKGYYDNAHSLAQAIYKIFMTPRYIYPIYDWNYGIDIDDLIGMPKPYVKSEIERRITDSLSIDDRINFVYNFQFDDVLNDKHALQVTFFIDSMFGEFNFTWEV